MTIQLVPGKTVKSAPVKFTPSLNSGMVSMSDDQSTIAADKIQEIIAAFEATDS